MKVKSKLLRKSAEGQTCSLRIASFVPGQRCAGDDTVVLAHLRTSGSGMGTKSSDIAAVFACHRCHDLLDGRDRNVEIIMEQYPHAYHRRIVEALVETQSRWLEMGLLKVMDPKGELI